VPEETLVYTPRRTGPLILLAVLILMDLGFAWLAFGQPSGASGRGIGLFALLVFGGAALAVLPLAIRPRAELRVGPDGILTRGHYGGEALRLAWVDVARVETIKGPYHNVVSLAPHDESRTLAKASTAMARAARASRATYGVPFAIDPRVYSQSAEALLDEMVPRHAAATADPRV